MPKANASPSHQVGCEAEKDDVEKRVTRIYRFHDTYFPENRGANLSGNFMSWKPISQSAELSYSTTSGKSAHTHPRKVGIILPSSFVSPVFSVEVHLPRYPQAFRNGANWQADAAVLYERTVITKYCNKPEISSNPLRSIHIRERNKRTILLHAFIQLHLCIQGVPPGILSIDIRRSKHLKIWEYVDRGQSPKMCGMWNFR